jgi:hypothetical protein
MLLERTWCTLGSMRLRIAFAAIVLAAAVPAATFAIPPQGPKGPVRILRPTPKPTVCRTCPQPHPTNRHKK